MSGNLARKIEKAVFEAARVIDDPETLQAFLDKACGGDAAQQARLTRWLQAKAAADDFFRNADEARAAVAVEATEAIEGNALPAGHLKDETEGLGSRIGPYTLLERIGEGGWGVVYLAEQRLPIRRTVALKIIRLGLDTEKVVARFEIERQALALMDHPNIAKVLDAGATESGRPFFVMEPVHGRRITEHCDTHQLGLRERIELFIRVCHAIQHAHQKGVIHRDIKPSNILVSSQDGMVVPKVIDFGIVMAVEGRLSGHTSLTGRDQFIGTPAYMSPEQADGSQDLDTRSDVYSLGVLLYELLTGATPFDGGRLAKAGMFETLRILREEEPPAPSVLISALNDEQSAFVAAARGVDANHLVAAVRGDLNWIVLKALSKDRRLRYGTVNGLAVDLQNYLHHEPVNARPPNRLYLFGKLVRRNKAVFASAAAVTLALVAGLVVSNCFYIGEREARKTQERLRKAAEISEARANHLLQQTKTRESISEAAVLLSAGSVADADALLSNTPLGSIEPAIEAANTFHSLGDWNAMRHRQRRAADYYKLFLAAKRLDRSTSAVDTYSWRIYLAIAPALVEAGDNDDYRHFRKDALIYYRRLATPLAASSLLRSSLLLPADEPSLEKLRRPAESAVAALADASKVREIGPFQCGYMTMALGLMEYRCERFEEALAWSERSMALPDQCDARITAVHAISALAAHQLGKTEQAHSELYLAQQILAAPFISDAPYPRGQTKGSWFDWAIARVLVKEAVEATAGGAKVGTEKQ